MAVSVPELPQHLQERCYLLNEQPLLTTGEFVLYWTHHALRTEANPALDTALALAAKLGKPLLVYQGLNGQHAHNNDRHFRFILESAQALQADYAALGIPYVFSMGDATTKSPLPLMVQRCAALVVEDYPIQPYINWNKTHAKHAPCMVLAVDAHCLVPMRSQNKRFDRAYLFRQANEEAMVARCQSWPAIDQAAIAALPEQHIPLTFNPVMFDTVNIDQLLLAANIDHSVPPVPHTIGGTGAAKQRWERFRVSGMPRYARDRNDAALISPAGVSRLSPYLHYGCISVLQIVAGLDGSSGEQKYLDELFIWRELAFNHCLYTDAEISLQVLPEWSQKTLEANRHQMRLAVSDENLGRAKSSDRLWNLAQQSLLVHGELHNNLRMTWGKLLVRWSKPEQALRRLFHLNNRYALDGNDPNSYGGLLWCLGLFDRAFPETKQFGALRARSSKQHENRLDIPRYQQIVAAPVVGKVQRIAVIGAGLSGLVAARQLQDMGHEVEVFEKARGPSGRLSNRRIATDTAQVNLDNGAAYFTIKDPRLQPLLDTWLSQGVVARWQAKLGVVNTVGEAPQALSDRADALNRYVGVPTMSQLAKHLADDINVYPSHRVEALRRVDNLWAVMLDTKTKHMLFDAVLVTPPPAQAAALVSESDYLRPIAESVAMAPCWSLMFVANQRMPMDYDGLFINDGPLGWVARSNSKPGREQDEAWVLHATPEWSERHVDVPAERVQQLLIVAFAEVLDVPVLVVNDLISHTSIHRWLYARNAEVEEAEQQSKAQPQAAYWDAELSIGIAGDWCQGGRVEAAMLSGIDAAARIQAAMVASHVNDSPNSDITERTQPETPQLSLDI